MSLPDKALLESFPLSVVIFGMGVGESIAVRVRGSDPDSAEWAVVDSATKQFAKQTVNPALDLLRACDAHPRLAVLTHPHEDHSKGFSGIVERCVMGAIVTCVHPLMEDRTELEAVALADDTEASKLAASLLAHAAIHAAWDDGRTQRWPLHCDTEPTQLGAWSVSVIHPSAPEIEAAVERRSQGRKIHLNNLSAALLFSRGNFSFLLAGDGEDHAWSMVASRLPDVDLRTAAPLKVPHHGSTTAQHVVLSDPQNPMARAQVVTPYSNSRIPSFAPKEGIDKLLKAAGPLHMTAMPLSVLPVLPSVSRDDAYAEQVGGEESFAGDDDFAVQFDARTPDSVAFVAGERDPLKCWVLFGVSDDGGVTVHMGDHALCVSA